MLVVLQQSVGGGRLGCWVPNISQVCLEFGDAMIGHSLPGSLGARSASMRFTGKASRLVSGARRKVVARAQSTTNGSAPMESQESLRTVDIDGTTFVAATQVCASHPVLATNCLPPTAERWHTT